MRFRTLVVAAVAVLTFSSTGFAQQAKPDDTPSISVGVTLFSDYTYTVSPTATDSDGNTYNPSAFNVTRSYININGKVSHLVSFRITPDISRETGAGSSLNGSLTFRVKYAFAQVNLDDYTGKGSWVRVGIQQTPWVDFQEGIYRYRFQGTVFSEREGFQSSSDAGVSYHVNLPGNYGDVHAGYYNGENYNHAEVNDQKSFQVRGTVRPLPSVPVLKGVRLTGFYDGDSYVRNAERRRVVGSVTFEHARLNAGAEYMDARDQTSARRASVQGQGYSVWATPKCPAGWEGLLRYDHFTPNTTVDAKRDRSIVGAAYWFPHTGNVSSALLVDYDNQTFTTAAPAQRKVAVHALVNF